MDVEIEDDFEKPNAGTVSLSVISPDFAVSKFEKRRFAIFIQDTELLFPQPLPSASEHINKFIFFTNEIFSEYIKLNFLHKKITPHSRKITSTQR